MKSIFDSSRFPKFSDEFQNFGVFKKKLDNLLTFVDFLYHILNSRLADCMWSSTRLKLQGPRSLGDPEELFHVTIWHVIVFFTLFYFRKKPSFVRSFGDPKIEISPRGTSNFDNY